MATHPIIEKFVSEFVHLYPAVGSTVRINHTGSLAFINFYNISELAFEKKLGGGAEAENNRAMYTVYVWTGVGPNGMEAKGVRVEQRVSVFGKKYQLRAKRGSVEQIAAYIAKNINKIAAEVVPNYTHSKPEET